MDEPASALDALAAETQAEVRQSGDLTEYSSGGLAFAFAESTGAVEVRLGADIADAARRTPDTTDSPRGDDWVLFAPKEWDDHARDRLEAWFRVAWRFAADKR